MLENSSGITVNKSHTAAYTLLSYKMAYCKAHFPVEFQDAVIQSEQDHPEKQQWYI